MAETNRVDRQKEWRSRLAMVMLGGLVFETLSGLSIYFLPFSLPNQFMVIVHTAAGGVFFLPYLLYQVRHWWIYRPFQLTHIKATGYLAMAVTAGLLLSGVVLTVQAVRGPRISSTWDLIHLMGTFALVAFLVPHVIAIVLRDYKARTNQAVAPVVEAQRRFGWVTLAVVATLFFVLGLSLYTYKPVVLNNRFPPDYVYLYGEDRPFAPSLATTETGGAFSAQSLAGSKSCGTSGCHEEILKEWQASAHRYSAMDAAFQAVQKVMAKQNGPESTRYCGGCHDPISLFSGTKNLFTEDLTALEGYQEGVSCLVCHAIKKTDLKGNASYLISQPGRYAFEMKDGQTAQFFRDFLIRAYPRYHVESLQHRLFKSPEFCAACHKQFIDQEVNNVGWVQLQNQYDNWRKSRWNHPGEPTKTIECRECHMPLVDSVDPAAGDPMDYNRSPQDGKHRSHRFLGANQFMPGLLKLPGAGEHTALIEQWLQGQIEIPEIADKWTGGPVVPVALDLPESVRVGQQVRVQVRLMNNKAGHDFPTGPLDIIQAWVELVVTDERGDTVFVSGGVDQRHFIQPGSFIFKAEAVDQYGNLIDRHNLWEMVGVRYRRAMFPGFSDLAEYRFACPGSYVTGKKQSLPEDRFEFSAPRRSTRLYVSAKLRYRKIDQFLLNFLMGEEVGISAPVTTMSEDRGEIVVVR